MTTTDKNITIAKHFGAKWHWTADKKLVFLTYNDNDGDLVTGTLPNEDRQFLSTPIYTHPKNRQQIFDLIIEKIQDSERKKLFIKNLHKIACAAPEVNCLLNDWFVFSASAEQLCDALLLTLGYEP